MFNSQLTGYFGVPRLDRLCYAHVFLRIVGKKAWISAQGCPRQVPWHSMVEGADAGTQLAVACG